MIVKRLNGNKFTKGIIQDFSFKNYRKEILITKSFVEYN